MPVEIDIRSVGESDDNCGDAIVIGLWEHSKPEKHWIAVIDGGYQADGEAVVEFIHSRYGTDHVDLMIASHPDCDHVNGLCHLMNTMSVGTLWMHMPWTAADIASLFHLGKITATALRKNLRDSLQAAHELYDCAMANSVAVTQPFAGLKWGGALTVLGPASDYYALQVARFRDMPPIDWAKLLGGTTKAMPKSLFEIYMENCEQFSTDNLKADPDRPTPENNSSTILWLDWEGYRVLFTADAGPQALLRAVTFASSNGINVQTANVVQVPHHGSRHNLSTAVLDAMLGGVSQTPITKRRAFVSAPGKGGPKHPSKRAMNGFTRRGSPVTWNRTGPWTHFNMNGVPRNWTALEPQPFFKTVEPVD